MFKKTASFISFFCVVSVVGFQQKNQSIDTLYLKVENFFKQKAYKKLHSETSFSRVHNPKNTNDSLLFSKVWHYKANAYYETANYFKAVPLYNKAIMFSPNNEEGKNLKGSILFDRAFAEYNLNQYVRSYKTVKKAEVILSVLKKPNYNYLLSIYADLGSEASYLGFYKEAEYYLKKGYSLFQNSTNLFKRNDQKKASKVVLFEYKFIYLYALSGEEQKLLKHLNRLQHLQKTKVFNEIENLMYASSFNDVGDYYLNNRERLGQKEALKKGSDYIKKAIKLLDKKKYKSNYIQFQFNIAKQLRYSKQFQKALKKNQEVIGLAGEKDLRIPFFTAQRGLIFLEKGNFKKAIKTFYRMASFVHKGTDSLKQDYSNFKPSTIINHTGLLVEIADELLKNNPKDSLAINQAASFYKIGLKQLKNSYQEKNFSKRIKKYYNKAIGGILKTKKLGYADVTNRYIINNIENIENKLAWKEFNQSRKLTTIALPDSILNKETYLRNKIVIARKNNDSLNVLELQNQLEKQSIFLTENYPKLSEFIYSKFDVSSFQKSLDQKTVVFKFKHINDNLYVFKISKSEIKTAVIKFNSIENKVKNYISLLKKRKEDKKLAMQIFKRLMVFDFSKAKTIIIIPDAILHHLPFETLVQKKEKYLIEDYTINYAPHLIFIKNNQKKKKEQLKELYLFSPSYKSTKKENQSELIGAIKESELIAGILKNQLFEKKNATKENFIKNVPKAGIIHLAMHAKIDNEKPELSYFSFSKTPLVSKNKMYLEELYALKLNASLAVLSACNTGVGFLENHNGAISLQRAFTLAGVSSTVSSLWEAPDNATQEIIVSFYKNLKQGLSKSKALQKAKIAYIQSHNDVNLNVPYYWAGFVISGDMAPIVFKEKPSYSFLYIIGMVFLLLFVFKLFQRLQKR